jgi:hypothetical protein
VTAMVTHFAGFVGCGEHRAGDSESAEPSRVSCLRCQWHLSKRLLLLERNVRDGRDRPYVREERAVEAGLVQPGGRPPAGRGVIARR